jgi:hypothetical protein
VGEGERAYRFRNRGDGYYTHYDEKGAPKNHYLSDPIGDPVAYEIETFISLCAKANLKILEILPEAWTGQPYRCGWQDIVILERRPPRQRHQLPAHLEDRLGDVKPDCRDRLHGSLL